MQTHESLLAMIFVCRDQTNSLPDVGISELEPGLRVVLLLRQHAIEPDHAWAGVRDGRIPYV
jgi:hypothetical protein